MSYDQAQLVADIYASATDPDHWDHTIREISRAMGGNGAAMLSSRDAFWSIDRAMLKPSAAQSYTEHFYRIDHANAAVMTGPVGAIRTGAELVTPYRNGEFYTDWLHPYDMEDALYVRLTAGPATTCFLVHSDDAGFHTTQRVAQLRGLIVHLQQALRIQHELTATYRRTGALQDAVDTSGNGVLVVGRNGVVLETNVAAERMVRAGDGLTMSSGRLGAHASDAHGQLQRAVWAALGSGGATPVAGACRCPRPSGRPAYLIRVVPFTKNYVTQSHSSTALVVIVDPELGAVPDTTVLRQLFGLTRSEADVAVRVMLGESPRQIAETLSVSFNTVRTHLSHVYDKTDTHRQSDLVRLLVRLT